MYMSSMRVLSLLPKESKDSELEPEGVNQTDLLVSVVSD